MGYRNAIWRVTFNGETCVILLMYFIHKTSDFYSENVLFLAVCSVLTNSKNMNSCGDHCSSFFSLYFRNYFGLWCIVKNWCTILFLFFYYVHSFLSCSVTVRIFQLNFICFVIWIAVMCPQPNLSSDNSTKFYW